MRRLESGSLLRLASRYVLTALIVFTAYWLRQLLDVQFGIQLPTFIIFYPAVMLCSLLFGLYPGLCAVLLSDLIADYWINEPVNSFHIGNRSDQFSFVIFTVVCILVCLYTERMRRSERRLATLESEASLRESRNLLQLFIEHSMNAVAMFNRDMIYMTASAQWCKEYGLQKDDLIGRSHYEVFPEIEERWKAAHQIGMGGETVQCPEDRFVRQDGRVQWLRWEVMPWRRADGSVGGIILFSDDISARKEAEIAQRTEHTKLELALACNPDATFITDTNGNLKDFNDAFAAFHRFADKSDYVHEFAEARKVLEFRNEHGQLLPVEQLPISRALRGEIGVNVEYRMRRIDINESWIGSFNFAPVRDQNNNIIGSVVTARDVTEQKNNLERLVESEARFRSLFEDNDSMFLLVDIQDGKIIDANWAAARFYGYSRETMQSMTILQLNGMSAAEIAPDLQAALKGTSKSFMRIHTLASGEKREMEALASVIEVNGRQVLFSVLRDVTEVKMAQKQLHQSEELYRTAFKTSLDAILITEEATGRIIDANNIFQEMVGHQDVYMQGKTTSELGLMVEKEDRQRILNRLRQEGSMRDFEFLFRRRNGEVRHGLMSASLIDIGGQRCIHSVIRDVTEEKLAAEKIRASEERYRTAFQTSIDAITITRMDDGRYLDVNQRFQEITEFARDEVLGKTSPELGLWVDKYDRDRFVDQIHEHAQCRDFQTRLRKKSGKLFWSLTSAAQIIINNERCILSVLRDVSDAKIAEEQIRNLAYFDPLTGLANRRMLIERLQHHPESEEAAQQYRALLLIDLNHFRGLNDAMGQPAGDVVLRETGMRLTSLMHNASLVARISGDAFAVELDGLGRTAQEAAAQAGAAATEIQSRIELPYQLEQRTWNLSCCIGIVVYAAHANDPHLILQQGDIALAQAKSAGRGSIRFFEVALQAAVEARAALEEELRQALINNEFELYYQPQLMYGNVIGAEALLRWNHPRHGLLTPGHFLPLAEENGLIYKLGEWVIESACKQLVQWSKSPLTSSLRLSINISSLDIRRKEFVQYILDTLERRGADPTRLQLEITESILMEDVSETIAKMHILKKRGLRFSIDDFGTGYSSLAYLKRFPIDELKIDISFVRDILVDNSSSTIAQAIISLGKAMDLVVVAEGVESEAQHEHLKQLGCRIFQGYFFGHPSPVQAFNDMLVRNSVLGAVN